MLVSIHISHNKQSDFPGDDKFPRNDANIYFLLCVLYGLTISPQDQLEGKLTFVN